MSNDLWRLSACDVAAGIRNRDFTSVEVVHDCLQRIEQTNDKINALTEVRADHAMSAAAAADKAVIENKPLGSLHGVPVTIKGNVDLAGWLTVNGSTMLKDNMAEETSPSVQHWLNAGAVVIGRTNTPEYCVRWETSNEVYGPTKNPWKSAVTPGGSSGGAAASLAVGMTPLAHGNDLGGSLRHPAQACGIASLRPTHGRVPNFVASSMEPPIGYQLMNTDGPMARTVADLRLGLTAMAGTDWRDPWCVPVTLSDPLPTDRPIAVVIDPLSQGIDDQVASGVVFTERLLKDAGHKTEHASPQTVADAVDVWKNVVVGEVFMGLEPAVKNDCGPSLRRAFEHYHLALPNWTPEHYSLGFMERRRVLRDWLAFFQKYDVIVSHVSTLPPQTNDYDIASPESTQRLIDSMSMVVAINGLGLPSVVVPVGEKEGLPRAVQVIGGPFQELRCLEVAEIIEKGADATTLIDPR